MTRRPATDTLLGTVPLTAHEQLRVSRDARGQTQLRVFFLRNGQWLPSRAGIEIPAHARDGVVDMLRGVRGAKEGRCA